MFGLTADESDAIYPANLASGRLGDGTQIGMPIHASENVLFYNHTWARELGFDNPPSTSAEFKEQACAAAAANNADDNADNDGTGGFVLYPDASQIANWVFAFSGSLVNDAGDGYTLNTDAMKEVALFLKDLKDNGCSFETESFPNPEQANRLALMTASSTAGIPFQVSAFADGSYPDDEWGLLAFPGPDGKLAVNSYGQLIGIMDQSPEANLASWIWLKYFTSPEVQAEWITYSAYFPSQTTTNEYLGDKIANDDKYPKGLEMPHNA
jgi:ABC-type glycerol-3-phosphate transport system substrate-binding protein